MRKTTLASTTKAPAVALPRLSAKLENLVDSLAQFVAEFGIAPDARFPARLGGIAFVNGTVLGRLDPAAADQIESLLAADQVPPEETASKLVQAVDEALKEPESWPQRLAEAVTKEWLSVSDAAAALTDELRFQLRILHGIRAGIVFGRESAELGDKLVAAARAMPPEHAFLGGCLYTWRNSDWAPVSPPFIQYCRSCYRAGSPEARLLTHSIEVVYRVAKVMDDPWAFDFWVETGWHGGRGFALKNPDYLKVLLTELAPENLRSCRHLYEVCLLGTAGPTGEVRPKRAALFYIGRHNSSQLAQSYCRAEEPRRLARIGFDFAFWMGILSALQVPTAAPKGEDSK